MTTYPPFLAKPLVPAGVAAADELATAAGIHGVYVRNVLHAHPRLGAQAMVLTFCRTEAPAKSVESSQSPGHGGPAELLGLAHFGPRGNLLVLEASPSALDPGAVAAAILDARSAWRIALGPPAIVAELVQRGRFATLVDREQIYYAVDRGGLRTGLVPESDDPERVVRPANRRDLDALMQAALQLNQSDLHVDPWCVDRDWLKRSTRTRIRKHDTFVIGPLGQPVAKLDIGSAGPAGVVIEGVFTRPELRGRGLASSLVAAVARRQLESHPCVCLHVASTNHAARRAYEKCGMKISGSCQLMLRS